MSTMLNRLSRVLMAIVAALLAALTIVVTFQVLGRYVPFIPRPLWTEEIARWLLAWLVFPGAAIALRRSDHFVIDVIPRRVEEKAGRALQVLVLVAVFAISLILLVGGALMTQGGLTRISTASGLHLAWAFAALPVGGLFMTIFSVELSIKVLRGEVSATADDDDASATSGEERPLTPGDDEAGAR